MSDHRLPREPLPQPQEGYVIKEVETGKTFPIREATDAQLAKHLDLANEQHRQFTRAAMAAIGQSVNAANAAAIIAYEIERRQRSISVSSDLSQLAGLRRQ